MTLSDNGASCRYGPRFCRTHRPVSSPLRLGCGLIDQYRHVLQGSEYALPRADLAVLVGEEGIGKGLWWCHQVAGLTRRGGHVLLSCAEDDYERVVRPRLEVAGAVLDNVHILVEDVETLT